jgi:hypothetical protein
MMLPAREIPEEDPIRTGPEGAAATPPAAPVDSGGGADAGKAAQPDTGVQVGKTAQADNGMSADKAAQAYAEGVAYDPPPATATPRVEVSSPAGADTAVNAETPASAVSPARDDSVDAAAGRDWSDVLVMFVDNPRGSVAEASAMVDEAINAFIATARARRASLADSWQAQGSDTEQLRVALQDYRTFWTSVTQLT